MMARLSRFIVEKRKMMFAIFLVASILSIIAISKVNVNYDLAKYLPNDSQTKIALDKMEEEFGLNGVANVVVANITPELAMELKTEVSKIAGVSNVLFEDSDTYYKEGNALIKITLSEGDYAKQTQSAITEIRQILSNYNIEMYGSSVHVTDQIHDVSSQMKIILAIAIPIIILILFLTANSYAEILIFGIVVGVSVIINKGTNLFLGEISYITNSIAILLQLALAMDYSIIFLHRFEEEKQKYNVKDAAVLALTNSITSICASSLTTIVGLLSIMFMEFTIGFDMGIVLAKSIVCSLLSVFFLMPGVIVVFSSLIEKTKHKKFLPDFKFIPKYIINTRRYMPIIMIIVVAIAFSLQLNNSFNFSLQDNHKSDYTDLFGETNTLAIIVPKGDNNLEHELINFIQKNKNINSVTSIASMGLRDSLTVDSFIQKTGIDQSTAYGIYASYLQSLNQEIENVSAKQMVKFMIENTEMLNLTNEQTENLTRIDEILNTDETISYQSFAKKVGLSEDKAYLLYAYYEMSLGDQAYQLNTIINFVTENQSSLGLTDEQQVKINQLKSMLDIKEVNLNDQEFASIFDLEANNAKMIYTLYEMSLGNQTYGLADLIQYMNLNTELLGLNNEQIVNVTNAMNFISSKNYQVNSSQFGQLMGLTQSDADNLFMLYNHVNETTLDAIELQNLVSFMYQNKASLNLTTEQLKNLTLAYSLVNNLLVNTDEFAASLSIDEASAWGVYAYYSLSTGYQVSSHKTAILINFINQYHEILNLSNNELLEIQTLKQLYDYSTFDLSADALSQILGLNQTDVYGIYAYYATSINYQVNDYTIEKMIHYLSENNEVFKLDNTQNSLIQQVKEIITSSETLVSDETFARLIGINQSDAAIIYAIHQIEKDNPSFVFMDLINYLIYNADTLGIDKETKATLNDYQHLFYLAIDHFESDDYAHLLFNINLKADDEEALKLVQNLRKDLSDFYDEYYVLGDSANILDIQDSFYNDVYTVNAITIICILLILAVSFKSIIIPLILTAIIQGSIWINFSFATITDTPIIFLGYIIITAIQMGATIDYAIVMTERYKEFRKEFNKFDAVTKAIHMTLPTLVTSGGILIVSGFSIGWVSTVPAISGIGILIGRGALISCLLVLFLLPQLLLIADKVIKKGLKIDH